MSAINEEDKRRLLESRHDVDAMEGIESVILEPITQQLLAFSQGSLAARREELLSMVLKAAKERSETDTERVKLESAVGDCIRRYGYARGKAQESLLNVSPDAEVSPAEIDRRRSLIDRYFRLSPSELERGSVSWAIEYVEQAGRAFKAEPDLIPLNLGDMLQTACKAALQTAKDLNREVDEDGIAMMNLRQMRENFDRVAKAHALLMESALVREGKEEYMKRYLLAKDPAYSARRAAREPIEKEPGVQEVDAETSGEEAAAPAEGTEKAGGS